MLFGYFTLFVALLIEVVGAYYSITGLAAIFSGAIIPILIMGGVLELGKVTAAVWLKNNWHRASMQFKAYLLPAVVMLMFITSMGIFGFLSKAHNDQNLVSGDVLSKISIYDEKIKIQKDNIESARKALQQMDSAVDQTMSRSTNEQGADKATAIRRSQARERGNLQKEIATAQAEIVKLNDLRAPIAAEVRKVEAEVGPIKYIAKLIYSDNPDANVLEKAVTWMILIIVAVFDPLALVLILAAQQSIRWARGEDQPKYEADDGPLTEDQINQIREHSDLQAWFDRAKERARFWDKGLKETSAEDSTYTTPVENLEPVVDEVEIPEEYFRDPEPEEELPVKKSRWAGFGFPLAGVFGRPKEVSNDDDPDKEARRAWKVENPNDTIKHQEKLLETGVISELPWQSNKYRQPSGLEADNVPTTHTGEVRGFGTSFPTTAGKGDMFLRVDRLPSVLYKFNGTNWIEIDKELTDQHAYDEAYIDHLIEKISTGEYDPDLLSSAERESIERRLNNNPRQV